MKESKMSTRYMAAVAMFAAVSYVAVLVSKVVSVVLVAPVLLVGSVLWGRLVVASVVFQRASRMCSSTISSRWSRRTTV